MATLTGGKGMFVGRISVGLGVSVTVGLGVVVHSGGKVARAAGGRVLKRAVALGRDGVGVLWFDRERLLQAVTITRMMPMIRGFQIR